MDKFFVTPFATTGDKTPIPNATQLDGSVSYAQGFGPDYQADPATNPDAKDVPRDEMNQVLYDLSNATREYQISGVPDFITSVLNGGTPFSYSINARVRYNNEIYESRINANTDLPTVATSWRKISGDQQSLLIAEAAGNVNAMTVTFTPAQTAYTKGLPLFIRAFGANSSGTPTINIDGLGAKTICKANDRPLDPKNIPGAGFWMILQYDQALDKMVLANPASTGRGMPGQLFDWAGITAPPGSIALPFAPWTASRTGTYADVYDNIGTAWGVGNGTTTFGLPYCKENYAFIAANGNVGTETIGENLAHTHSGVGGNPQGGQYLTGNAPISAAGTSNSTGGPINMAAGMRTLKCMWI